MFNLKETDISWQPLLKQALQAMDQDYLQQLSAEQNWLPGAKQIFNAFKLPLSKTRYILFGESPYPRSTSANGFAFWDAQVNEIWSEAGLSKTVNRATSLRNLIKMLLVASGALPANATSPTEIAKLNKAQYVATLNELFQNFLSHGFLLLNATLVLSHRKVTDEGQYWLPFIKTLLHELHTLNPTIKLILFGKISEKIEPYAKQYGYETLVTEHPYNLSFIQNKKGLSFFHPLNLLKIDAKVNKSH